MSGAGKVMKRVLREEVATADSPGTKPMDRSFDTDTMPERNDG
jgi:hypothetical protein